MIVDSDILLSVAKRLHSKHFGSTRGKYRDVPWDDMDAKGKQSFVAKVEPTMLLVLEAGFVIIPESEVNQAWRPRKEVQVLRSVVRLSKTGGKLHIGER